MARPGGVLVKPQAIAALALIIVLLLGTWFVYHLGYTAAAADSQVALDREQDANRTCTSTIARLKLSVSQCESDRVVDLAAQTKAVAQRNAEEAHAQEVYKTERDALLRLMHGDCKEWAKQAACGSVP